MTDWPVKTLGEVCEVLDSLRKPITKRDRTSGDYPYYGATGIVDYVGDYIFDERLVLVGEDGAKWGAGERTAFIADGKYWVNNHAHVLRCKQGMLVDSWLANFLTMSDLNRYVSGLTVPKLNQGSLVSIEIPVPPLEEQKRIVALLDAATARVAELTACYEQARTHANNLFTSALRDALESNPDWPVKTLGEICDLISRGRPPAYCEEGGALVLNQKCVRNGEINFGPARRTDNGQKPIPEWAYLQVGDTLINSTGAGTLGRASFVCQLDEPTTFDTHLTVVRPLTDICWPAYVGLVLNSRERDIVDLAGGATGQTELPREAVRSFEILVPPLEEQKRIVAQLDLMRAKTSEMVTAYDAKLVAVKNLRQSVLEAAFAGEL
jgi:type I restriction enzyme S subunit